MPHRKNVTIATTSTLHHCQQKKRKNYFQPNLLHIFLAKPHRKPERFFTSIFFLPNTPEKKRKLPPNETWIIAPFRIILAEFMQCPLVEPRQLQENET